MTIKRTSLTQFADTIAAAFNEPDQAKSRERCPKAFHDENVLCVRLDEATERKIGWAHMAILRTIGAIMYGKSRE